MFGGGATFSGAQVSFDGATFSGGRVPFQGATFGGGVVSFDRARLDVPPTFDPSPDGRRPDGLRLPTGVSPVVCVSPARQGSRYAQVIALSLTHCKSVAKATEVRIHHPPPGARTARELRKRAPGPFSFGPRHSSALSARAVKLSHDRSGQSHARSSASAGRRLRGAERA
ncbi:pentapeptide repeat-containing protein [Micromonospora aurantiaca]|uniref:pentapeptide repeat-containing protein n=1 Tax=Micromonospora aurantiaca (nom. illeg.) TaxID=47850 RepID=UPI0033F69E8C